MLYYIILISAKLQITKQVQLIKILRLTPVKPRAIHSRSSTVAVTLLVGAACGSKNYSGTRSKYAASKLNNDVTNGKPDSAVILIVGKPNLSLNTGRNK